MNEPPDKPEDKASDQPQPDEGERPQLRELSQDELKQILTAHEKWVQSDGKDGERADLDYANLQNADLTYADLRKAYLEGANLQGANLGKTNLQGADLTETEWLTQEQLDSACGDAETNLPPGLTIKPCPEEDEKP